ncbi:LysR substrate-binding domain-containing protein [Mycetohabitans sp. B6]|uniref:LysR substrate-binding domain-containing protein n=1 Tax=Mycetohabitans TaxID=2571159 RepID=UPI0005A16DC6
MRGYDQPPLAALVRIADTGLLIPRLGALDIWTPPAKCTGRDAAVAKFGIVLRPRFIVAPALDRSQLVTVLEPFAPVPLPLSVVYPLHRQLFATCWAFVRFIEERLRTRLPQ